MALTHGPWEYGGGNGMRVGIDPSTAAVTHASTTVVLSFAAYTENQYNYDDFQTLTFGGSAGSGTYDYNNQSSTGSGDVLRTTRTYTYTYPAGSYGTSPGSVTFSATVSGAYNGVTPSHTVTVAIPARPYGVPAAPTAATVARVSDTSHTITWTSHSTTGEPYSSVEVQRSTDGGAWARIATLGNVSSYTDTTTSANHQYQWRVRASNSAGTSGFSSTQVLATTPAAPGAPTAVKTPAGSITLTWTDNSPYNSGVEVWHASAGVWDGAPLASVGNVTTWTHTSPSPSASHQYRLRATTSTPALSSVDSPASNTVTILAPPNPPSGLTPPPPSAVDATTALVLSWVHNPTDTTAQTKYEVQHRVVGAGSWTSTGTVTSTASTHTLAAGTYANGVTIEWQARTWGLHATASAWSSSATVVLSAIPTATIATPTTVWGSATLTATWAYYDPEAGGQYGWRATLSKGSTVVESLSALDAATTATFATRLQNGQTYTVTVAVCDPTGQWSLDDSATFTVTYDPPPTPTITATFSPDTGATTVTIVNPGTAVGEVDVAYNQVWRAQGSGWVLVADQAPVGGTVTDNIPPLGTTVTYMAVAVSATPSTAMSAQVDVDTSGAKWAFFNGGADFGLSIRLSSNVSFDVESGLEKALHRFAGRARPVEFAGTGTTRTVNLSGTLFAPWVAVTDEPSTWADIEALAMLPGPHCFRDPSGIRIFGSVAPAQVRGMGVGATRSVGLTLTETDWSETVA